MYSSWISIWQDRLRKKIRYENNGCWIWLGATKGDPKDPYGHYRCTLFPGETLAHRVSYLLFQGHIPEGKMLLHSCDVRLCVNPHHTFPGNQLQNQQDMTAKGRGRTGIKNGRSKLSEEEIQMAIKEVAQGRTCSEVSRDFKVAPAAIRYHALKSEVSLARL